MVEYILKKGWEDSEAPFSYEDINTYRYSYYGEHVSFDNIGENELDEIVDQLNDRIIYENLTAEQIESIENEISEIEKLESEPVEIYEWWAVSSWLAEKLEEKGEVVFETGLTNIWGRQTTGQAILLDWVISEICEDLGKLIESA